MPNVVIDHCMTGHQDGLVVNKNDNSVANVDLVNVVVVTHLDSQQSSVQRSCPERQGHLPRKLNRGQLLLEGQLGAAVHAKDSADGSGAVFASPLWLAGADVASPPVCTSSAVFARTGSAEITLFRTSGDAAVVVNRHVEVDQMSVDVNVADAADERGGGQQIGASRVVWNSAEKEWAVEVKESCALSGIESAFLGGGFVIGSSVCASEFVPEGGSELECKLLVAVSTHGQNCGLVAVEDLDSVKQSVRKSLLPADRNRLDFVSGRKLKDDRLSDNFERDEVVFVVEAAVVEDEAFGLCREVESDVELVSRSKRWESGVGSFGETSRSELTKLVEKRVVGTISANLKAKIMFKLFM